MGDKEAAPKLTGALDDPDPEVRTATVESIERLGDGDAVLPLKAALDDADGETRQAAVKALVKIRDRAVEKTLLSRDLDEADPWIDPNDSITEARIEEAAACLGLTRDKVYSLYASIAADFHLQFE
ncbi:MAG: HEAT repeat domain-containing protein [Bryobacteraceae bacterium]|jgi:HEAT repeat protein